MIPGDLTLFSRNKGDEVAAEVRCWLGQLIADGWT